MRKTVLSAIPWTEVDRPSGVPDPMRGMRSYVVRDRLVKFAISRAGQDLDILSYDIAGRDNRMAVAVSHYLFGSVSRKQVNGGIKEYRYPGLIEREGVVWLGQSVFLLTPARSRELRAFLDSKGVAYGRISVRTT